MADSRNTVKLHLLVLCAVIWLNSIQEVNTLYCKTILEEINNCWNSNSEVPDCKTGTDTELYKCSHTKLYELQNCSFYQSWEGAHRTVLFSKAMDSICEKKYLREEFLKDGTCWNEARDCAKYIVLLPKQPPPELCRNITRFVNACKSKEQNPYRKENCSEFIQTFVDSALERSEMCGAGTIFAQVSLVLIALSMSLFGHLLRSIDEQLILI